MSTMVLTQVKHVNSVCFIKVPDIKVNYTFVLLICLSARGYMMSTAASLLILSCGHDFARYSPLCLVLFDLRASINC